MEEQINSAILKLSTTMQEAIKFIRTDSSGSSTELYSQRLSECFADLKTIIENIDNMKPKASTLQSKIAEQQEIIRQQEQLIAKVSSLSHNSTSNDCFI